MWHITKRGLRLAFFGDKDIARRIRWWDDGNSGLSQKEHTLAINDIECSLLDLAGSDIGFKVSEVRHEPDCWFYHGTIETRPDKFIQTEYAGKIANWFIEYERTKKKPILIRAKCQEYREYIIENYEKLWAGNVPTVLWICETAGLKKLTQERVNESLGAYAGLCRVITPDELVATVLRGEND
jgi:hypothetical protein